MHRNARCARRWIPAATCTSRSALPMAMIEAATTGRFSASGIKAGNFHHYWDAEFVALLETDEKTIASDLIGQISKDQQKAWQAGSPSDWAKESFQIAKADAYGLLGAPLSRGSYVLSEKYIKTATADVALQLSKAGVRLAFVLNNALRRR